MRVNQSKQTEHSHRIMKGSYQRTTTSPGSNAAPWTMMSNNADQSHREHSSIVVEIEKSHRQPPSTSKGVIVDKCRDRRETPSVIVDMEEPSSVVVDERRHREEPSPAAVEVEESHR